MDFAAEVFGPRPRDRVAGHGHQRHVAGVDERRREHGVGRLAADAVANLGHRIERHAELAGHELGGRFLVIGDAVVGVAAILELVGFRRQRGPDVSRGHVVVFADTEIEEPPVGEVGQRLALGALDLLELVDVGGFAVGGPPDALGEKALEPGVGGHRRSLGSGGARRADHQSWGSAAPSRAWIALFSTAGSTDFFTARTLPSNMATLNVVASGRPTWSSVRSTGRDARRPNG